MQRKKTILIFITGAIAVALTIGAVAYNSVLAATPTATGTTSTLPADGNTAGGRGHLGAYSSEELAKALGITVDELTAAKTEAYSAALSDAVSQGLITQAQADELTSNGSAFPFGGRWEKFLSQNGIDFNTYLAKALDISLDELNAAYKTTYFAVIDQAVTDGRLTQEQADYQKGKYALYNDGTFQSSMQSAFTSAVNQAVSSGVITQSQADQILSNSNNQFGFGFGGMGSPAGFGGRHGHGGGEGIGPLDLNP